MATTAVKVSASGPASQPPEYGQHADGDSAQAATNDRRVSPLKRWLVNMARPARLMTVLMLDGVATLLTLTVAAHTFAAPFATRSMGNFPFSLLFVGVAIGVFFLVGLYRRSWRFLSFSDGLFLASAVAAGLFASWTVGLIISPIVRSMGIALVPFALVHGALLLVVMGAMRVVRRGVREYLRARMDASAAGPVRSVILFGELDWARAMINLVTADLGSRMKVVAVVTPDRRERRLQVAGVRVIDAPEMLPVILQRLHDGGVKPETIILRGDGETLPREDFINLIATADRFDLTIARARAPWHEGKDEAPKVQLEQLPLSDLLGRPEIKLEPGFVSRVIAGRKIMVTGAGGTIGSELVRQLATFGPAEIVLLDHSEFNLYTIDLQAREAFPDVVFHTELCSIRQKSALRKVFKRRNPELVFHAAALKHVPMVEANPSAGVHTNVLGTRNVADAVCEFGARAMIQVSTDKAVNPVGLMGATKRLGELYCQALDLIGSCDPDSPRFMTVRFGNVLGSSGSLIPLFQQQIAAGKPLTVTHPDIERYFMTVEEAVQLILQSSSRALETEMERGNIFVLDMGEPVKILDIAKRVIRSAGLRPEIDVDIRFIGLRPGEKLFEELFDASEERTASSIPGVFQARPCPVPLDQLVEGFTQLERMVFAEDQPGIKKVTSRLIQASARSKWAQLLVDLARDDDHPAPRQDGGIQAANERNYGLITPPSDTNPGLFPRAIGRGE